MKVSSRLAAVFVALGLCSASGSSGSLIVQQGIIYVEILPSGISPLRDLSLFSISPIQLLQSISYQQSFSNAQYDASWSGDNLDFHVDVQQRLQGYLGRVQDLGAWSMTPAVDSLVTLHGEYTYDHPTDALGSASISTQIKIYDTNQVIGGATEYGGTTGLGPHAGHLVLDYSLPLSAGVKYRFSYLMESEGNQSSSSMVYLGSGFYDISVRSIPEPATLLPIALAALLFLAPGRRSRRAGVDDASRRSRRAGAPTPPAPPLYQLSIINSPFSWER
jgi:hypothetical protein